MNIAALVKHKPLIFFDLETTGLNVVTDRIVQIAAVKYLPGAAEPIKLKQYINPGCAIPAESAAIHGITDEVVANAPSFAAFADQLLDWLGDADLSGYNLMRFDIPLLMEEFERAGIRFRIEGRNIIDVQEIFYKMEPRTLAGAVRYYCGKEMENAHDALADVEATIDVLAGQLNMYLGENTRSAAEPSLPDTIEGLAAFTRREGQLDATNRLREDEEGEVVFNFGKYKGQRLKEVFRKEKSYYHWLQDKEFSVQVKEITRQVWESM